MICDSCTFDFEWEPAEGCLNLEHWKKCAISASRKLEQHDDDRDKLDVAEWLSKYPKVKNYNCHGCGRHYELPTHLTYAECVCGHRSRLRHLGGINPDQDVIDAAIVYFGNERSAQLAWLAEVVAGQYCLKYTADDIREMIRRELGRWKLESDGWRKIKP